MLTCQQITEFLSEYLEGSLPRSRWITFRLHLLMCRDCRRYLDSYEKTRRLVGLLKEEPTLNTHQQIPEGLVQAILAARRLEIDKK